jgi:hypothetical protein
MKPNEDRTTPSCVVNQFNDDQLNRGEKRIRWLLAGLIVLQLVNLLLILLIPFKK